MFYHHYDYSWNLKLKRSFQSWNWLRINKKTGRLKWHLSGVIVNLFADGPCTIYNLLHHRFHSDCLCYHENPLPVHFDRKLLAKWIIVTLVTYQLRSPISVSHQSMHEEFTVIQTQQPKIKIQPQQKRKSDTIL